MTGKCPSLEAQAAISSFHLLAAGAIPVERIDGNLKINII
jgi:hypothetical protein